MSFMVGKLSRLVFSLEYIVAYHDCRGSYKQWIGNVEGLCVSGLPTMHMSLPYKHTHLPTIYSPVIQNYPEGGLQQYV